MVPTAEFPPVSVDRPYHIGPRTSHRGLELPNLYAVGAAVRVVRLVQSDANEKNSSTDSEEATAYSEPATAGTESGECCWSQGQVKKSDLLKAIQGEVQRHNLSTLVAWNTRSFKRIVRPAEVNLAQRTFDILQAACKLRSRSTRRSRE
jgi:hypothetical protein